MRNVEDLIKKLTSESVGKRVKTYLKNDIERMRDWRNWIELKRRVGKDVVVLEDKKISESVFTSTSRFISTIWQSILPISPPAVSEDVEVDANEFFLPGKIIHVYSKYGVLHAGYVSRHHPGLNRVELQPEMVSDHFGEKYFAACSQLIDQPVGVVWKSFDLFKNCGCCGSDFLWNSVLKGEPHIFLAKRVCRRCGAVVCESCRGRGRVCERCKFGTSRL